jgi:hypothetical protein
MLDGKILITILRKSISDVYDMHCFVAVLSHAGTSRP